MAYMKQNVNFVLLFLIILASITIVGATIYFQVTLHGLSGKHNNALEAVDRLNRTLYSKVQRLEDISYELEVKAQREGELSSQFADIKGTKETLEEENLELQNELETSNLELVTKIKEVSNLKKDVQALEEQVKDLKKDVKYWKQQYEEAIE